MSEITTVGVDLAKNLFQLHGVDVQGSVRLRRRLARRQLLPSLAQLPPCVVAMEACASAHYWAREIAKLGHQVRLISPQFVKPFVRGNKNDGNDAAAICAAALATGMRFVAVKSVEQQELLALHRIRELTDKHRRALMNQLRGLLAEFGIVMAKGSAALHARLSALDTEVPARLRAALLEQQRTLRALEAQVKAQTRGLAQIARDSALCRSLMRQPGVGPLVSTAYAATVGDPRVFKNGRQVAAWLGLVPRHCGTGGKTRLLGISKRGDRYLRMLLIHGARAVVRWAPTHTDPLSSWVKQLSQRCHRNVVTVAVANKTARRLWALMHEATLTPA